MAQDRISTGDGALTGKTLYDGMGRPTETQLTSDPEGTDYADTTYDGLGRVAFVSYPYRSTGSSNGGMLYLYDVLNRETSRQHLPEYDDQTHWVYNGNLVDFYNASWTHWQQTYDGLGRMTVVKEPDYSDTPDIVTNYSYDALGNLASVVQQGNPQANPPETPRSRSFAYDWLSRLTSATNPETGTTLYSYNAGGGLCSGDSSEPCSRTDARGITTNYSYDAVNRLTGKTYSNEPANAPTPAVSITYDALDQPPVNYQDNYLGHMTQIALTLGSQVVDTWVAMDYDQMGRSLGFADCLWETDANCDAQMT